MTIYVIDDHPMMREAVATLLRKLRPQKKIIELEQISALASAVEEHGAPTFFYLDLMLPDTMGVSGIRSLKNLYPLAPLAVLSGSSAIEWQERCVSAGADIYIDKAADANRIGDALQGLFLTGHEGENQASAVTVKLSDRQIQILALLSKGMSNCEMSVEMDLAEKTVNVHLWRLYRRINVSSRTQAVRYAYEQGLIEPPTPLH
jgi:DNA-binding NarL/FixJ family response regulator